MKLRRRARSRMNASETERSCAAMVPSGPTFESIHLCRRTTAQNIVQPESRATVPKGWPNAKRYSPIAIRLSAFERFERSHRQTAVGRRPRFPVFGENRFWKNRPLPQRAAYGTWLRTHATGQERPVAIQVRICREIL